MGEAIGLIGGFLSLLLWTVLSFRSLAFSTRRIVVGFQSRKWHSVIATLVTHNILEDIGSVRTGPNYGFTVTYKYIVNGVDNTSVFQQRGFHNHKSVEHIINTILIPGLRLAYFLDFAWAMIFFGTIAGLLSLTVFIAFVFGKPAQQGCQQFDSVQGKWISAKCTSRTGDP
jgi:hypothetical protein